ncbi:preprotein translocase subunit SecA [compost metagenome]
MQPEMLRQIERMLLLRVFDQKWIEHLHDIDALRDGIGLRAYGQKDPLQEYKREAYELFQNLLGAIQHDIVRQVFHVQVVYDMPQSAPMHIHNMVLQGPDGVEAYDPAAEESKNA